MTSPERAPAREPEPAPARPKRTTHRIVYSPELLAELRELYERTPVTRMVAKKGFAELTRGSRGSPSMLLVQLLCS